MTAVRKNRRPTPHGPALLAVDVGNSEITLGVFQDDDLMLSWRLRSIPRTPDKPADNTARPSKNCTYVWMTWSDGR